MKPSKTLIAAAVVALLPLAAVAGDKDKSSGAPSAGGAHFDSLDVNRDGRVSRVEAAADSKIVFEAVDKNADGYIDSTEYLHRAKSDASSTYATPSSQSPESASPNSPGTSSKTDPNQQQGTQPATARPDEQKPR
jgi:hypothetical protein